MEHNYYANYFSEVSGLVCVSYWDFWVLRGLTSDFAGVFEGGRGVFVSAMGCEL
jgi:hypothetical protein